MLGASKRVRGNPVNIAGDMRVHIVKYGTFRRSGIGQDGAGFHRRHDLRSKGAKRANRHRHDHKIGILHGGHSIVRHMIDKPQLFDFTCLAGIYLAAGNAGGKPRAPRGKRNRRRPTSTLS